MAGEARRGEAWRGLARNGRQGPAWQGPAWQGMAVGYQSSQVERQKILHPTLMVMVAIGQHERR